jgi:hypothetical protein
MPASLEKVLDKALERDAANRFSTAGEFADAIESSARAARMLGTHQDVKAFLTSMMGEELEQRREALRAHLTDIDRLKQEVSRPRQPEPSTPLPEPALQAALVSSVSSAAMEIPAPPAHEVAAPAPAAPSADAGPAAPPERKRTLVFAAIGVAAVAVIAIALFLARGTGSPAASTPSVAGTASSSATPTAASVPSAPASSSSSPASALESATASPSDANAQPDAGPQGAVPRKSVGAGKSAASVASPPAIETPPTGNAPGTSTVPPSATDDLKHNPYR